MEKVLLCTDFLVSENIDTIAQENRRLFVENKLNAYCSYYDIVNEYNTNEIVDKASEKIKGLGDVKIGGAVGGAIDFVIDKALPTLGKVAKSAWETISKEGKEMLLSAGEWCLEHSEVILFAIDVVDYVSLAVFVVVGIVGAVGSGGIITGGAIASRAMLKGTLVALKKQIKNKTAKEIAKKVGEKELKGTVTKEVATKTGTSALVKTGKNAIECVKKIRAFKKGGGIKGFLGRKIKDAIDTSLVKPLKKQIKRKVHKTFRTKAGLKLRKKGIEFKNKINNKIDNLYKKVGDYLGGGIGETIKASGSAIERKRIRKAYIKNFVKRFIRKKMEFIKRILKRIEKILALIKFLFQNKSINDLMNLDGYPEISALRKNIYSNRISYLECPPHVNEEFLKKWTEEGLEEDNKDIFVKEIKDFKLKCDNAKINGDFVRGLVSYTLNAVDLTKDEYLLNYSLNKSEIKQASENTETGNREDDKMKVSDAGNFEHEATEDYEDFTDILEKYFIKNGYKKNENGSEFVNEKTKIKFKLSTITKIYWDILHQFVVALKD